MVTLALLEKSVGGLSTPSKMPGLAYGIPAALCPMGSILRKIQGSVCSKCYAHKGMYVFPNVKLAHARRMKALENLPTWQTNMIALLGAKYARKKAKDKVFRWHDSGDLQSPEHLAAIVAIAEALPEIHFWLPSKEWRLVSKYLSSHKLPANLVIRLSMPNIGQASPNQKPTPGLAYSTVDSGMGFPCEAKKRGGKCGPCRACWNPNVRSVDYAKH